MNGNGSVNLGRDSVTLEPLQLLQPTPKSLLFNIYHSRLGPQLLPDPAPAWPSGPPPRPDKGKGEKAMDGVAYPPLGWDVIRHGTGSGGD